MPGPSTTADANTPTPPSATEARARWWRLYLDLTCGWKASRTGRRHAQSGAAARDGPMAEADLLAVLQAQDRPQLRHEIDAWVHGTDDLPLKALLPGRARAGGPAPLAHAGGPARAGKRRHRGQDGAGRRRRRRGLSPGDEWLGIELPPAKGAGWRRSQPIGGWRLLRSWTRCPSTPARRASSQPYWRMTASCCRLPLELPQAPPPGACCPPAEAAGADRPRRRAVRGRPTEAAAARRAAPGRASAPWPGPPCWCWCFRLLALTTSCAGSYQPASCQCADPAHLLPHAGACSAEPAAAAAGRRLPFSPQNAGIAGYGWRRQLQKSGNSRPPKASTSEGRMPHQRRARPRKTWSKPTTTVPGTAGARRWTTAVALADAGHATPSASAPAPAAPPASAARTHRPPRPSTPTSAPGPRRQLAAPAQVMCPPAFLASWPADTPDLPPGRQLPASCRRYRGAVAARWHALPGRGPGSDVGFAQLALRQPGRDHRHRPAPKTYENRCASAGAATAWAPKAVQLQNVTGYAPTGTCRTPPASSSSWVAASPPAG